MHHKTIGEISKRMAGIDIAVLSTHTEGGQIANRPMSNNGDVEYDGTSYYFTYDKPEPLPTSRLTLKLLSDLPVKAGSFRMRFTWRSKAALNSFAIRLHSKRTGQAT